MRTIPSYYNERQARVIKALADKGLVLRTDPRMRADYRVTGDQVVLNLDVAEQLFCPENLEIVDVLTKKGYVQRGWEGGNMTPGNYRVLADQVYLDLAVVEDLLKN